MRPQALPSRSSLAHHTLGRPNLRNLRIAVLLAFLFTLPSAAQNFTERGFLDLHLAAYPQTAPNDASHAIGEALFRYEALYKPRSWLRLNGAFDARADTHREVERAWRRDWRDRGLRRPAFSFRRLSANFSHKGLTLEAGKQFIRWGKTDILNPTDRFAPRDFLTVTDTDFLGVTGARLSYEAKSETLDLVWVPLFTPSRTPLLSQRWTVLPAAAQGLQFRDLGARYPGGSQLGARWNHIGRGFEASVSFYQGFNHLPLFEGLLEPAPARIDFRRFYPTLRMYGADAAIPLSYLTLKAEAAWFATTTPQADEYTLYVIQLERQSGEWAFVGGYAGEVVTKSGSPIRAAGSSPALAAGAEFAPDRGLSRAFLARASYTIDAVRSVTAEAAVRQNGKGALVKAEYSHLLGQHWRAIASLVWIAGEGTDFLGQYHHNSHANLTLRYSF